MNSKYLPGILAMAAIVVASNILVQFLFGQWLTWGAFTYPLAFLVTDIMNRVYGAKCRAARCFRWLFGGCRVLADRDPDRGGVRAARDAPHRAGSGIAFLTAQMLDVAIFDRMRAAKWWQAPVISSIIGSSVDTALFFTIAFSASLTFLEPGNDVSWAGEVLPMLGVGPEAPLWVSLALADWLVKMSIALLALIPFRIITRKMMAQVA
jgi:uncharacterized PurR-regulated membrane protein YhhQ (DUF165 family)